MNDDGLMRALAAGAGACGVFAIVTGQSWAALTAGVLAVATAVLTLRTAPTRSDPGALDLREDEALPPPLPDPVEIEGAAGAPAGEAKLLDDGYIEAAIRGRIAVAKRALRPVSVVHISVALTDDAAEWVPPDVMAAAAITTLRESDIVGRRGDGTYVFVLEDTAEDGAVWTTERLRRHLASTVGAHRFQAGVASYPNHGLDAVAIDSSAARALEVAREWNRDRIEVATTTA